MVKVVALGAVEDADVSVLPRPHALLPLLPLLLQLLRLRLRDLLDQHAHLALAKRSLRKLLVGRRVGIVDRNVADVA